MKNQPRPSITMDLFGPQLPEFAELPDPVKHQLVELLSKLLVDHCQLQVPSRRLANAE